MKLTRHQSMATGSNATPWISRPVKQGDDGLDGISGIDVWLPKILLFATLETCMKPSFFAAALTSLALTIPHIAHAQSVERTVLVLDASGSMWGQIGGEAKITIAQRVIGQIVSDLPEDAALGLYGYGHREKGSCTDIERLVAPEPGSKARVIDAVNALRPNGKTPLTDSVIAAAEELKYQEDKATVVLVSDGRETCERDPCAMARALEEAGVDFTVHVIGFDVAEEEDIRQLSCIAEETGGQFLSASDAGGLVEAMQTVVVAPPPPPPVPQVVPAQVEVGPSIVFDFEGEDLGPEWTVIRPDLDEYVVDGGELVLVSGRVATARTEGKTSIVTYTGELPRGDWDMVVEMTPQLSSGRDQIEIGLYGDYNNYLASGIWTQGGYHDDDWAKSCFGVQIVKMQRGERTFDDGYVGASACPWNAAHGNAQIVMGGERGIDTEVYRGLVSDVEAGITFTLRKRGRNYSGVVETVNGTRYETPEISAIRPPGPPMISVGKWYESPGEVIALIDRVTFVPINN